MPNIMNYFVNKSSRGKMEQEILENVWELCSDLVRKNYSLGSDLKSALINGQNESIKKILENSPKESLKQSIQKSKETMKKIFISLHLTQDDIKQGMSCMDEDFKIYESIV